VHDRNISREMVFYCEKDKKKVNFTGNKECLSIDERLQFLRNIPKLLRGGMVILNFVKRQ